MSKSLVLLICTVFCACSAGTPDAERSSAPSAQTPALESAPAAVAVSEKPVVHVWKDPTCGCCTAWVEHLRASGYTVEVEDVADIDRVKREHHIPGNLTSCHTGIVGGYVIEGHVPADVIDRLLAEHPQIRGLAVPGMPVGAPGMEVPGEPAQRYDIVAFDADGSQKVYESR